MTDYKINRYKKIIESKDEMIQSQQEEIETKDRVAFTTVLLLLASLMFNGFLIVDKVMG
ncbi:hypothetical protein [Gracilibacillus dipsosauri]|uniref:hypothetical protein n=1 Tax=Gracilibacillus dipsosauri TaxID=178340 RepID=UPI0015E87402|nr:hypothetical protein [Gracilibacillus dipsosauri]